MAKITVLGAGAWGSTMAQVLVDGSNDVLIWGRREEVVAEINTSHTNTKYLGSQVLNNKLSFPHQEEVAPRPPTHSVLCNLLLKKKTPFRKVLAESA